MTDKPTRRTKGDKPKELVPHGKISEKRVAKKLGSRLTPCSGAMIGAKGDARQAIANLKLLYESKSTVSDSIPIKHDWLAKVSGEALVQGAIPVLTVSFLDQAGKPKKSGDWVMLTLTDFKQLLEARDGS